jgi:energy-coupling factor transporter transmembrane protein EcfT
MSLPVPALAAGIACAALAALVFGFSPREQITDLQPAAFYGLFLYALSVFSVLLEADRHPEAIAVFTLKKHFLPAFLRLALVVQLSALIFRSTTSLEIRGAVSAIEASIRKGLSRIPFVGQLVPRKPRFAEGLALFAAFIPELFQTWTQIDLAWRARNGKPGLKKIKTLIFALITLSFSKASEKAKALTARGA